MAKEDTPAPEQQAPVTDNSGIVSTTDDEGHEIVTPVEVEVPEIPADLADGTPAAVAEEAAPAEKPRKVRPGRQDNRIQNLTARVQESETARQRMERENADLIRRGTKTAEQYESASTAAMQHFKDAESLRLQLAQRDLKDAIEAGDAGKQAEAQTVMSKAQAELSNISAWEASQDAAKKAKPAAPQQPQPQQAQQRQQPQQDGPDKSAMHADTQSWISENADWFEPGSETFDAEMHTSAVTYAQLLDQRYIRQGKGDQIGTRAYTQEIDRHMQTEFPDAFDGEPEPAPAPAPKPPPQQQRRAPPMAARAESVAASTRTLPNGVQVRDLGNGKKTAILTADQRSMAHQLAKNGALTIADGKGGYRTNLSLPEAERIYAMQLINDPKNKIGAA